MADSCYHLICRVSCHQGGLLPYQEKKHDGERLVIPAVKGEHMGDYSCTVDNGVGQPVVEHIRLEVNCECWGSWRC